MKNTLVTVAITLLLWSIATLVAGDPAATAATHGDGPPDAAEFWTWLDEAEYENWGPFPGHPAGFYEGSRPHGAKLKTYVNRVAAANPDDPPHGSIIVKENYSPDEELAAITIMKRVEGFAPDHGDWWWVKYTADGDVAEQNGAKIAGAVESCIACHDKAGAHDYVFANDE